MFNISVGVMAYNEEANIGKLLDRLLTQVIDVGVINEIVVVSSGSTDRTDEIVRAYAERYELISLIIQRERKGKASAINLFLDVAKGDICVLESADTLPEPHTIEKLVEPFYDPTVGMTGAHPVPVNNPGTFIGFAVNLMWSLHHKIALISPKLGELVAFRNCVKSIPDDTAVDEASIEAIILEKGFSLRYASDAIVLNKGPENLRDFMRQRERIAAGHTYLMFKQHHHVSTSNPFRILALIVKEHSWKLRETIWILGVIILEMVSRINGFCSFLVKKRNPFIWDIATSTKALN